MGRRNDGWVVLEKEEMVYNYLRGRLVIPLLVVVVAAVVGTEADKGGNEEEEEEEAAGEEEVEDMTGSAASVSMVGVNAETSEPEGCGDFREGKDGGVDEVFSKLGDGRVGDSG